MTIKQRVLQFLYPLIMKASVGKKSKIYTNNNTTPAPQLFYNLNTTLINGDTLNFETLKNKKVLLVNTASDCGFTAQYDDLEQLQQRYNGELVVIGFPANDFKEQEKRSDKEIEQFCQLNFGVTFPLASKSSVTKVANQNKVFRWLTSESQNGWHNEAPAWNFTKYLVNEEGELTHVFGSAISPLSTGVIKAIEH